MISDNSYIDKHLFNHLVNNSRSMLSVVNRNYCYEKVNNTFCRYLNIKDEDIIGKPLSEIWGEDIFRTKIKNNIDLCFQGNIVRYEANFEIPMAGERYFEVLFKPLSDVNGNVTHLLAETLDITDRKVSQKAVNEMEQEFRKFESSIPVGFVRCDLDGTIIHYNKAFAVMLEGDIESEFGGLNIKDFYADKHFHDIHLIRSEDEKIRTFRRVPLITCKGKLIMCRLNRYVVPDGITNKPLYFDFAVEDITREVMLENRLLQAKKLETIGSLAGGIAHDFNNILLSLFGYSEMLIDEVKDNPAAYELTGRIIKAVSRAKDIVNQILTFSRQVEQEKIPVNITGVLDEAISLIESSRNEKIRILKNYNDTHAEVFADPTQLFRVFMNLMMNGLQAMEKSGGILEISLDIVPGEALKFESGKSIVADKYVKIRIKDTGTGMSDSVMSRIFDPYFTTKEIGKGSGLGLSVSYGIISELEGEITVYSEPNKGSVFSVYLPLIENYSTFEPVINQDKKRIMFISDETCRESKLLSGALGKSGYVIDIKTDIEGLYELIDENIPKPDILIFSNDEKGSIDSGFLKGFIKEKNIDIPVILLVNNNFDISKDPLINSGIAKNVLFKPVSLKEILSAIRISVKD